MKFCILGNHRDLSIAEIQAVTGVTEFASTSGDALVFETDFPSVQLQERLAGTIKVGSIVGEVENSAEIPEFLATLVASGLDGTKVPKKIIFGISVYDAGDSKRTKELRTESEKFGLEVKKRLKADGHSVRLVTSREKTLSAVVVTTNHLIESGGEFVLIVTPTTVWIGQTEAVQDFEAWGKRDFGRPARDAKSGMLPPKLARMMINLTGLDPSVSTILDPFCGSGTIPMEAALLGFKHVIGTDISKKAIADTQSNIAWLKTNFLATFLPTKALASVGVASRLDGTKVPEKVELFVCPAQVLSLPDPVDAIVTETYLGPALHGNEHVDFLKKNIRSLSELYRETFGSLRHLLNPKGKAIVAFPVFRTKTGWEHTASKELMESLGFTVENRFHYDRAGQNVGREIFILTRQDQESGHEALEHLL